jgi:hypothetical protein
MLGANRRSLRLGPQYFNVEREMEKMRSLLMILLTLIALFGDGTLASAMSREPRKPPLLRNGNYRIDFGRPEIVKVSTSYAYTIFFEIQSILIGTNRTNESPADENTVFETLQMSCRIERVANAIKLSVSIVHRDTGEPYFVSEQEGSFFSPERLLQAFASDFFEKCEIADRTVPAYASSGNGISVVFGGLTLGPVLYFTGGSGLTYGDFYYDLKTTSQLPRMFVDDFDSFKTRKNIEGIVFYGSGIGFLCTLAYWGAVSPNERPTFSRVDAPTLTVGLAGIGLLAAIPLMADQPYKLLEKFNIWLRDQGF